MRNLRKHLVCGSTILIVAVLYVYVMQDDDLSELDDTITEYQLLVANTTAITKLNVENSTVNLLYYNSAKSNDFWIGGLDCSYELDGVYFSDIENAKLYALDTKTNKSRLLFTGNEHWFPICLAVEDVTGKLYVGDLIQGGLTVHDINTADSNVILGAGLLLCVALAVDAREKYIFVVDKYQILRLDLDGKNAKTIHELADKMNMEFSGRQFRYGPEKSRIYIGVDGMTLDRKRKRIYWASGRDKKIESSDYNGDYRQIHFRDNNVFDGERSSSNSLAIFDNSIYWADPIERRIIKIKSLTNYDIVLPKFDHATIASCHRRVMKLKNPCEINNGGCQMLCLLSKSNNGYSCACKVGYELENDGKSCRLVQDYVLFMEGGVIKGLSLGDKPSFVFQPPGFNAHENSWIDIDVNSGMIYYTARVENNENMLHERKIDGSDKAKILTPDLFSRQAANFAYDWTTKNLYYLSQYYHDAMTLCVTNMKDPRYTKILVKNLIDHNTTMRFYGSILHPNKGYLFLVVVGGKSSRGEIKRMSLDGSDIKVIYKAGAKNSIGGLAVDYEKDRIYWGEVRESGNSYWQSSVKSSNLNGDYRREFDLTRDIEMPIGMAIYRDYIYGIDVGKRLFRMNRDGKYLRILVESGHLAYSVKIHNRELQVTREDHPCKNHECRKFCFAVPSVDGKLKAVCGCPYGQKLASDSVSCVDNSNAEPEFKACDDRDKCKMN